MLGPVVRFVVIMTICYSRVPHLKGVSWNEEIQRTILPYILAVIYSVDIYGFQQNP
jgi:hypothetical protein